MKRPPARLLTFCLWLLMAVSAIGCIVLPVIGTAGIFREFGAPYSAETHFRILVPQLAGPGFTLLCGSALAFAVMAGKRIPWWLWLPALIGPVYTHQAVGGLGHDFSHVVFEECSGVYQIWISTLCIAGGNSLIALSLLGRSAARHLHPAS